MMNNSLKKLTKGNWSEKRELTVSFLFSSIITLFFVIGVNFASTLLRAFLQMFVGNY